METLIAVRVDDVGDGFRVTGFVGREKNRKRCWTFKVTNRDKDVILAMVEEKEKARLAPTAP